MAQAIGQSQPSQKDLTNLGLEDLMKIQVTTASKSAESVSKVPSAIYVITQDMIRRAGAQTIPDALRLAPGVDVAQINANQWSVSIRGFNDRFTDKLLVLLDGRSVYTPDFSGVLWESFDVPMQDIDRIEVIRGPGGSLWGTNAVNGVINIITKSASDTQGGLFSSEAGSFNRTITTLRDGLKLGTNDFMRFYAKYRDTSAMDLPTGGPGPDEWKDAIGGFRFDGGAPANHFMVEGSIHSTHVGEQTLVPSLAAPYATPQNNRYPASGWDLTAHWDGSSPGGWTHTAQASIDRAFHGYPEVTLARTTLDFDYQARTPKIGRNTLTLGAGYRTSPVQTTPGELVTFTPASSTQQVLSFFLHDDYSLARHVDLLAGSKFEDDSFAEWVVQPNLQLLYTPDESHTWWASVSRAVRTPSISEEYGNVNYLDEPGPGGVPVQVQFVGSPTFKPENVIATEAGFRWQHAKSLFVDAAAFDNEYTDLRTFEPVSQTFVPVPVPHVVATYQFSNELHGNTDGLELTARWVVCPSWKLTTSYSYFTERLRLAAGSHDPLGDYSLERGGSPRNQFQIRSDWDVTKTVEFDNDLYYTDATIDGLEPTYWRLDSRLGWKPCRDLRVSLGVRNALQPLHTEGDGAIFATAQQVPRSAYLDVVWKF